MVEAFRPRERLRELVFRTALLLIVLSAGGCTTVGYYRQAIQGEYQILSQRKQIDALLSDPTVNPKLKQQFERVKHFRDFAQRELKLPINKHYITYSDLHRRFAVWNVHAAPEFSLEPKKWWYPLIGRLKYRGYFSESDARNYADQLSQDGYDVYVEGVEAYSTLGWFADPLLNTFLNHSEADLAEIIFHELAHQRLFFSGDTDFNEAFATAVAEEGVHRWFLASQDQAAYSQYLEEQERNRQFVSLVLETRRRLADLFGSLKHPSPASPLSVKERKAQVISDLREAYQKLKASWGGYSGYDEWFSRSLNNAQLNTVSLYYDLVPGFRALLQQSGGDLETFYKRVQDLKKLNKDDRHRRLHDAASAKQVP